ncbi:MAG: FAD-binding oxidoreductase [Ignavibacteria bacterium]|nr:FAD-binding oxidoreductase [Ignavibacteria bacterium]
MNPKSTSAIQSSLEKILSPERVHSRWIDRLSYASDASCYRIIPEAVVRPNSIQEIQELFKWSTQHQIPLCFRAAGTSLSGQSVTHGVIVDISRHWKGCEIIDDGSKVRVQPGIIGGKVNQQLKKFSAKLGPDPASINACMTGGIIANNSSGMCCGVKHNSYHTVESIAYILPNGVYIDTAEPIANQQLEREAPEIYNGILALRKSILEDDSLIHKIRSKYKIKNTVGYSINAFLDYEHPADILGRLMVGSEGTLGFIASATFRTIEDMPCKETGMLYFPDIHSACKAIVPLRDAGAEALEIMDRAALRSVEHLPIAPPELSGLSPTATALLVEFQASSHEELESKMKKAWQEIEKFELILSPNFTRNHKEQALLWQIRKGMFPTVGAMRASGTALLNEDVAFPIERLADAVLDLHELFKKYAFVNAIVFGHAKDGNLHFVATQAFDTEEDTIKFGAFMDDLAVFVIGKYNGSLKAEHGTGRHITPYVETEWGEAAYSIMKQLKMLVDPNSILNPGVMIEPDHRAHLRNLKSFPQISPEIDKCIECGFCESKCPSTHLTLTPRQRIILWREMERLPKEHQQLALEELNRDFLYSGIETCATDGMCATVCPVGINTGEIVKLRKREQHSAKEVFAAKRIARNFSLVMKAAKLGLKLGGIGEQILGKARIQNLSQHLTTLSGGGIPQWNSIMRRPPQLPNTQPENAQVIYFPSCTTRLFGQIGKDNVPKSFLKIANVARVPVYIPQIQNTCCGLAFSSKGFTESGIDMWEKFVNDCWEWTLEGKLPVVIDASSCSLFAKTPPIDRVSRETLKKFSKLKILDIVEFIHDYLLPKLELEAQNESIVLHPNCSLIKMGHTDKMEEIAKRCARKVTIPENLGCCGFAGDKGLIYPELTASATKEEADEINKQHFGGYYSSNVMCEMGMTAATNCHYNSIVFAVEKALVNVKVRAD